MAISDLSNEADLYKDWQAFVQATEYAKQWSDNAMALSQKMQANPVYQKSIAPDEAQYILVVDGASDTFSKDIPIAPTKVITPVDIIPEE